MGSPLDDIEFLARSEHRVTALHNLVERPRSRADLLDATGVSSSTIGRTLREFEARRWVVKDGHLYAATQLGAFVASGLAELVDRVETERKLRDVWDLLPIQTDDLRVGALSDAVVTIAETADPYRPVNRFVSLLRETDSFRFVGPDLPLFEPCRDELRERIVDGMRTEIIDSPRVAEHILSTYPEHCSDPLESGNLTVSLCEDLPPYGVSVFDRRIGISGYDRNSGTVRVLIDTDAPEAREWAESTYRYYRREARPLLPETVA